MNVNFGDGFYTFLYINKHLTDVWLKGTTLEDLKKEGKASAPCCYEKSNR